MPLSLKQQMVKTLAQRIVGQPDKFSEDDIGKAKNCIDALETVYSRPEYTWRDWERMPDTWADFRPILERALPVLSEGQ
jgi:hypothetical protein